MQGILRAGTVLIGILFLLISAAFLFAPTLAAGGFGISPVGNQGLATLRVDMTSLFAALGALLAWGGWTSDRRALNFVAGLMVVALVVYAWGFEWLGFPLATALLTAAFGLLFGATLPAAGVAGVVMGIALWYVFDALLDVTLPLGVWLS